MKIVNIIIYALIILVIALAGCSQQPEKTIDTKTLFHSPLDDLKGVITQSGIEIDQNISSDGKGSLRIDAEGPITVNLFEVQDIDIENARLMYQARVRSKGLQGQAYLEMLVHMPGKGEFFTRNVHTPATGTMDWTTMEAPFFLKTGQNPDYVKLNLVIAGTGTMWIDDIRLVKGALP
jgi:hypothetical protein